MQGRRSLSLDLAKFESEIERTFKQRRKNASGNSRGSTSLPSSPTKDLVKQEVKEEVKMADDERKPLKAAFVPTNLAQPSCINFTPPPAATYTIPSQLIHSVPQFRGTPSEDPHLHLREFADLCRTQKI